MPTTIAAATDALINKILGLAACQPNANPPALVSDGFPHVLPDLVVSIAGHQATMAACTRRWAGLGAYRQWEDYTIHGAISAQVGGEGFGAPEQASDAQKQCRDLAMTVTTQLESALIADPTLGGSVSQQCGWVLFEQLQVEESTEADAALGRNCTVKFAVKVIARI